MIFALSHSHSFDFGSWSPLGGFLQICSFGLPPAWVHRWLKSWMVVLDFSRMLVFDFVTLFLWSHSSGDSRPRVQGLRPQWFTEKNPLSHCTTVTRTVDFFHFHSSKFHCTFILKYIIPRSCSTSSWSKANMLQCNSNNKGAVFWCWFAFATTGARSNNINKDIWDEDTGATSSIAPSSLSQLSSKWQQFLPKEVRFTWLLWRRICVAGNLGWFYYNINMLYFFKYVSYFFRAMIIIA